MAIKDLPNTFFVDFYTLLEQSNNFIFAIAELDKPYRVDPAAYRPK